MAGLAKLGDKVRSSNAGKTTKRRRKKKKEESYFERAYRLKKELPWPYDTLVDLSSRHLKKNRR